MQRYLLLFCMIIMSGCSSAPEDVARGFLGALSHLNFPGAGAYVVPEQRQAYERLQEIWTHLPPAQQNKFRLGSWKIVSSQVNGSTATVQFEFGDGKTGEVFLISDGHGWKVESQRPGL